MDHEVLGEFAVYPGHPVTLAYIITQVFDTYEEASGRSCSCGSGLHLCGKGWPNALGDSAVPGAGGNVYGALDLLARLHKGMSWDDAIKHAVDYWDRCDSQKTAYPKRHQEGQEQAEKFLQKLKDQSAWWSKKDGNAEETPSYDRV